MSVWYCLTIWCVTWWFWCRRQALCGAGDQNPSLVHISLAAPVSPACPSICSLQLVHSSQATVLATSLGTSKAEQGCERPSWLLGTHICWGRAVVVPVMLSISRKLAQCQVYSRYWDPAVNEDLQEGGCEDSVDRSVSLGVSIWERVCFSRFLLTKGW